MAIVADDPQQFLGQSLTAAQVKDRFVSCLKVSPMGVKTVRCKMNTNSVACWDEAKEPRGVPDDWTAVSVKPRIVAKGVWAQSSQWGILLEHH
jgi:hypothetical protein